MKNCLLSEQHSPTVREEICHSPRMNPGVRSKILSFAELKEGWDFGQGVPTPRHVVMEALKFYGFGEQLGLEMDAFPGVGGDISVDFYIEDELVQVLINPDTALELTHEKGIGSRYEELAYFENIDSAEIIKYLTDFRAKGHAFSWSSSDCFTGENIGPRLNASLPTVSRSLTQQYPSSKSSVFKRLGRTFASTFVDITKPLRTENRLLFGSLLKAH